MRIRYIMKESLLKVFIEYKVFILVFLLGVLCEIISGEFYSLNIGEWSLAFMIIASVMTLIILGVMISLTNSIIYKNNVEYFNFIENFLEGLKEYIINMYYMILTFIFSSLFIIPTRVYSNLLHIHEFILTNDINTTFLTIHELSEELPINLQLNLASSIQFNLIISMFIFVILTSFGFIGKYIITNSGTIKEALNIKVIFGIIKEIGFERYAKFLLITSLLVIILFNIIWSLEYYVYDVFISAFLEAFFLFFATNAFYLIITDTNVNVQKH